MYIQYSLYTPQKRDEKKITTKNEYQLPNWPIFSSNFQEEISYCVVYIISVKCKHVSFVPKYLFFLYIIQIVLL